MYSLAIEISSQKGSFALFRKDGAKYTCVAEEIWEKSRSHSEIVTVSLQNILSSAQISLEDLDSFCIGRGPGSFTGIRVAVNLVKSLSYSLNKRIYAIDSLMALALPQLESSKSVVSVVNAIKNRIYMAHYTKNGAAVEVKVEPQSVDINQLFNVFNSIKDETFICGNAPSIYPKLAEHINKTANFVDVNQLYPAAIDVGKYCLDKNSGVNPISWQELIPLYIRGSQAEEKLKEGLLKPLPKTLVE